MNLFKHSLVLFLLVTAAACSAPVQSTPQTIEVVKEVTVQVPATVIVKETVVVQQTVVVTATPLPPTNTPLPTPTAEPFQKWTASEVLAAFKAAGLEAEEPKVMTKEDIGMLPYLSEDMYRFLIPSLCADCGGRVFNLKNQTDADITKGYYDSLGQSSAAFFSWTFAKDNIVLQINGKLSEEKARAYEAVLMGLGK